MNKTISILQQIAFAVFYTGVPMLILEMYIVPLCWENKAYLQSTGLGTCIWSIFGNYPIFGATILIPLFGWIFGRIILPVFENTLKRKITFLHVSTML